MLGKEKLQVLYEKFMFMNDEEFDNFTQKVSSGVKKNVRLRNIKAILVKFKNFLFGPKKILLPEGKINNFITSSDKRAEWLNSGIKYDITLGEEQIDYLPNKKIEKDFNQIEDNGR